MTVYLLSGPGTGGGAPLVNPGGGQNNYAPLASPVFTGNPQAPTQASTDASNDIATMAALANALGAVNPTPNSAAQLRYSPPTLSNPTTVSVPTGYYSGTFTATTDVILSMPAANRTSAMAVSGGRNVQMIGGSQQVTATGTPMRITNVVSSIYLEGVWTDNSLQPSPTDAMNLCGRQITDPKGPTYPDIYLQNCRTINVHGQYSTNHSDVYQPQGPIGNLYVDKFTANTNYQGFFISAQYPITSVNISRTNLSYNSITPTDPTTYLIWLYDGIGSTMLNGGTELIYPTTLSQVYCAPRASQNIGTSSIWPASSTSGGIAAYQLPDGTWTWPAVMKVSGVVTSGSPPNGDYCPVGTAGYGYTSPGYQSSTPTPSGAVSSAAQTLPWDDTSIVTTFDFRSPSATGAYSAANQARGGRVRIPKAGTLHDIAVQIGTPSGNISCGIYDLGVTTSGTRTQLWATGGTLNAALSTGGPVTSLTVAGSNGTGGLASAMPAQTITLTDPTGENTQTWSMSAAAAGATSVTVTSQTPNYAYPVGSMITGSITCPTASGLTIIDDPAQAVLAGEYLEFWLAVDNTTVTVERATPGSIQLPSSYNAPPGGLSVANAFAPVQGSTFPLPATLPGNIGPGGTLPLITCRIG